MVINILYFFVLLQNCVVFCWSRKLFASILTSAELKVNFKCWCFFVRCFSAENFINSLWGLYAKFDIYERYNQVEKLLLLKQLNEKTFINLLWGWNTKYDICENSILIRKTFFTAVWIKNFYQLFVQLKQKF